MLDSAKKDRVLATISSLYRFNIEEETDEAFIIAVDNLSDYPEDIFTRLVNRLGRLGFVAFTGQEGSNRVYIVQKRTEKKRSRSIKIALVLASLGSVIYTGYIYQTSYSGNTSFMASIPTVLLLFLLPLGFIIAARELGRFVALRMNGMEYHLPIMIPDPFGMGVLGSIAGHEQAYVSRRAMFHSGLFPLISGFIASLSVIAVGSLLHLSGSSLTPPTNSSFRAVSLPLTYTLFLGKLTPLSVALNLMQYAGWIGIIINALNAFPMGFLDGGLISKSLTGRYSNYISYATIAAFFALSIPYLPWLVLILFVLLTGVNGPEPLLSSSRLSKGTRVLTAIAMFIFVFSIVPVPYHVIPNNISVDVSNNNIVIVNGSSASAAFNFTVFNLGGSSIAPVFTIQPSKQLTEKSTGGTIPSGGQGKYSISLPASDFQGVGKYNYTVSVYSGTSKINVPISILVVNLSDQLSFNNAVPFKVKGNVSAPIYLNFSYTSLKSENFSMFSYAVSNFNYSVTVNNITFHEAGYSVPFSNLFSIRPGDELTVLVTGYSFTSDWTVVIVGNNYDAAIAYISLGGPAV